MVAGSVNVLNDDGSARTQKVVSNGSIVNSQVKMTVPTYQLITPGGDTQLLGNFEYRIPIFGPVILAPFFDAGVDKILRSNQLTLEPTRVGDLNTQFPQAGYSGKVYIAPGTQKMRASTGLELQVMMPVVNAPFRLYWAYNPNRARTTLQPPIVADRSSFPNYNTFINSVAQFGQGYPYYEKRTLFRFTIGRTF